jgi:hypothetical protein
MVRAQIESSKRRKPGLAVLATEIFRADAYAPAGHGYVKQEFPELIAKGARTDPDGPKSSGKAGVGSHDPPSAKRALQVYSRNGVRRLGHIGDV